MKIALISDIHSNYVALESVFENIKKQDIDQIFCLGDLIGYAPYPNKIFPLLNDSIKSIMGNYDEAVAFGKDDCGCNYVGEKCIIMGKISFEWTVNYTFQENKEWMKNLPKEMRINGNGKKY